VKSGHRLASFETIYDANFFSGVKMDATVGLFLVIGFPTALVIAIWAFDAFSKEPE